MCLKRSARGVVKGLLRDRFVKKLKVLPKTRTNLVPSDRKTAAPDGNLVRPQPGPLQDKDNQTDGQTFQQLTNVMSKAYDINKEMAAEQTKRSNGGGRLPSEKNGGIISTRLDEQVVEASMWPPLL